MASKERNFFFSSTFKKYKNFEVRCIATFVKWKFVIRKFDRNIVKTDFNHFLIFQVQLESIGIDKLCLITGVQLRFI